MEQDTVDRLKIFALTSEERDEINLEEKDVRKSKDECQRSLLGKSFGTKKVNFAGLRNTLTSIWQTKDNFAVKKIGTNLFQFIFHSQEDKVRVLQGKTWTFDNQYLILKEWYENILENVEQLNSVNLWIQIWNLPLHWISVETGIKIGRKFAGISDVHIPEAGSSKGSHIRIMAKVNLHKPLLRGTNIKLGNEAYWLDFLYENLQNFCFYCGLVGHLDRGCQSRRDDFKNYDLKEGQFGDWLRAGEPQIYRQEKTTQRNSTTLYGAFQAVDKGQQMSGLEKMDSNKRLFHEKVDYCITSNNKITNDLEFGKGILEKSISIPQNLGQEHSDPNRGLGVKQPGDKVPREQKEMEVDSLCDSDHLEDNKLVNIQVKFESKRTPLKEINTKPGEIGNLKGQENKQMKRIPKKGRRNKLEIASMEVSLDRELSSSGHKRVDTDCENMQDENKKMKLSKVIEDLFSKGEEVEEPNLNWAHPHQ